MTTRMDILSGFLGAGKSTLILKLIDSAPQGESIAIIENEFGEVGIDGDVFKNQDLEVVEINSGCVCCTLSSNLITGLKLLIARVHPDRIILEPTGLAGLADIHKILVEGDMQKLIHVGASVAVVHAPAMLYDYHRFLTYYENQIMAATLVVLNRMDSLSETMQDDLVRLIHRLHPGVHVLREPLEGADLWLAMDLPAEKAEGEPPLLSKEWLSSFKHLSIPMGWHGSKERMEAFAGVKGGYGEIVRAKGYVYDDDGKRFRVDLSGGAYVFEPCGEGKI